MKERKDITADKAFTEEAKQLFDESVAGLDANTRSRLNRGRQAALKELATGRHEWAQWVPAAGVAAAAVFAVVLWTASQPVDELTAAASAADFEILLTEDSFEMLEDLEFYSWIEFDEEADGTLEAEDVVG
jgi:hypothetical protein